MAVNTTVQVTLPAMGESVREGTVLEWHKQEGDAVEADEPLVDVSTDKVDAEVPAPASGTLVKILAAEGDTVAVGAVLAEIAPNGAAPAGSRTAADAEAPPAPAPAEPAAPAAPAPGGDAPQTAGQDSLVDIVTPAGGESVQEGTILEWSVQVGDSVQEGDTVVELSTDKVDMELPAPVTGTIAEILAAAGDTVAVGQTIARMRPGPDAADGQGNGATAARPAAPPDRSPAEPAAPPPAHEGNGAHDGNGASASPVARRVAAAEGIDLSAIAGSGPAGRITKADVLAAKAAPPAPQPAPPAAARPAPPPPGPTAPASSRAAPRRSRATWRPRVRSPPRPRCAR